jgi:hypothetical protein
MAVLVLKEEKKIADVVRRAYGDLKPADRKRAEAALLRANPQLAPLDRLAAGAILVIPRVPGLRAPVARTELPAPDVVAAIRDEIGAYRVQLGGAGETERSATTALTDLLKSKEMKAVLRDLPDAGAHIDRVGLAAKVRVSDDNRFQAFLKALAAAQSDLNSLLKKLS